MLKKTIIAALCCAASGAQAVPLIDLKIAAGTWDSSPSGDIGESATDVDTLDLDDDQATFFSVALEHPIPVLPNIKLKQTDVEYDGETVLTETFTLDEQTFSVDADLITNLDLSHTDVTLYWGLPELLVDIDFGLTARIFDGEATALSTDADIEETVDLDVTVPMLYAAARFDLPLTGVYIGAEANGLSVGDNSIIDYSAAVGYSTDIIPFIADLDFEIGYRNFSIELDEDDIQTDVTFDGLYAQIMLAF